MHLDRTIYPEILSELKRRETTILLGARQVGKTYLLKWLKRDLDKKGVPSTFFNLEDPEHLRLFNQPEDRLFSLLTTSGKVVFIDEFHYLKNASRLFKAVFDSSRRVKIFASGSSSLEIHKHLKESLVGRRHLIKIYPLSYAELEKRLGKQTQDYYFRFGGLPGVIQESTRKNQARLLEDMIQAYLLKDIKSLIKEENIRAFNTLLYLLAQSQGSLTNVDSLSRQIGLTARSVQKYLDIMAHTYVLHPLPSFSRNLGNELKKSKKYYLYDLGIRNALLKDFRKIDDRDDKGPLAESMVFLNLFQRLEPNEELRFWRTQDGHEVDFILLRDRQPIAIEVKNTLNEMQVPSGLKAFLKRYPETKYAVVFNNSIEGKINCDKIPVYFKSLNKISEGF